MDSGLIIDQSGNLFGSSWLGGGGAACTDPNGCGFVFQIASDGKVSMPYNFCAAQNCADGEGPVSHGGIALDGAGHLYGTTHFGGAHGDGVVFRLSGGTLEVLHDFCIEQDCGDGAVPFSGAIVGTAGALFGTTISGGNGAGGTVFELSP